MNTTEVIKIATLVVIWIGGTVGFYYYKYGSKDNIEIMSVAKIEKKYKKRSEELKKSIF